MKNEIPKYSKFLSYILRHQPEAIGLRLDKNGWANTQELLEKSRQNGKKLSNELLDKIVAENNKKRFAFNEDKSKIRASQGHSLKVELQYDPIEPPTTLYHGTVEKNLTIILQTGIKKMQRQQVHLSHEIATALNVGARRGKPIILLINARKMYEKGYDFFKSENGVWLTDFVPAEYLEVEE